MSNLIKINLNKFFTGAILVLLFFFAGSPATSALVTATEDPSRTGIGARPLGMGGAFVAVCDDANSIFINPAGLAKAQSLQFTSMYSVLLEDIYYTTIGIDYPMNWGTLGLGYIASGVGDIPSVNLDADDRPDYSSETYFNYINSVLFLCYGTPLNKFLASGYDIDLGMSLKYFSKGYSGSFSGTGTGFDMDVGLTFQPYSYLTLGLCQTNILPYDSGGRIIWGSGYRESIPSLTKFGAALQTRDNLIFSFELRRRLSGEDFPATSHAGFDWRVSEYLSLRFGYDQSVDARRDVYSNYGFGVGIHFNDWHADYAYHPYFEFSENLTHYASLSYYEEKIEKLIQIDTPSDMTITFDDKVMVSGKTKGIKKLLLNGGEVSLAQDGSFAVEWPLNVAKNTVVLDFIDAKDKIESHKLRILRKAKFADVAPGHFAFDPITLLATLGIIRGYPDGNFYPERDLTRAEFATLLAARYKASPDMPAPELTDIAEGQWFYDSIRIAVQYQFMKGYPDKSFRPRNSITRAEAVLTLVDFDKKEKADLDIPLFEDMPRTHWASQAVYRAKEDGMLFPLVGNYFEPNKKITRGETAYSLSKTDFATKLIDELLNWEVGY